MNAPEDRVAKCPRCGNDLLTLIEDHEEHGVTDPGYQVIRDGELIPAGPFYFSPGEPIRRLLWCETGCGNQWACRWPIGVNPLM